MSKIVEATFCPCRLQRAQLSSTRNRTRGRGIGQTATPGGGGGHSTSSGAKTSGSTTRKQRRGQGSLERRREARAAAREAALAQQGVNPSTRAMMQSDLLATAPVFEPIGGGGGSSSRNSSNFQWQQQHNKASMHHRGETLMFPQQHHPQQPQLHSSSSWRSTPQEQHHHHGGVSSQMGSSQWAGWTMICDMLTDSEPANRASAVNTLRVMTNDTSDHAAAAAAGEDRMQAPNALPYYSEAFYSAFSNDPLVGSDAVSPERYHPDTLLDQKLFDSQRDEACQAVLENGALGQLVGLLNSDEDAQTQIAATQVLRNVVSHAARYPADQPVSSEQNSDRPLLGGAVGDQGAQSHQQSQQEQQQQQPREDDGVEDCVKTIIEGADFTKPIVGLLDSEDAVVRSSALDTVSELAHASAQAREQFFQEPSLLPHLLDVVEHAQTSTHGEGSSHCEVEENNDDEAARISVDQQHQDPLSPDQRHDIHSTPATSTEIDEAEATMSQADPVEDSAADRDDSLADRAQAMGVLKLMLDEEDSAKRVRDAIATRPGVVESIVDVATMAPHTEESNFPQSGGYYVDEAQAVRAANDALVGLGGNSREVAATAVVQLLGQQAETAPIPSSNNKHHADEQEDCGDHRSSMGDADSNASFDPVPKGRQLAAMALMRNLVTAPDPTAPEDEQEHVPDSASLRAVRNAGGVDAVVSLLGHDDPHTQASASYTLMAMVKADDESKRFAKLARSRSAGGEVSDTLSVHSETELGSHYLADETSAGTQVPAKPQQYGEDEAVSNSGRDVMPPKLESTTSQDIDETDVTLSSLRAEIAENEHAIPRLVSVLSRGMDEPAAAVQAAATLATLFDESETRSLTDDEERPDEEEQSKDATNTEHEQHTTDAVDSSLPDRQESTSLESEQLRVDSSTTCSATEMTRGSREEETHTPSISHESTTSESRHHKSRDDVALIKQQLKQAIETDDSVIPAVVELLRDSIETGSAGANETARHLVETLRAMASSDLVNQMRICDAGGVRPIVTVLAQAAQDEHQSSTAPTMASSEDPTATCDHHEPFGGDKATAHDEDLTACVDDSTAGQSSERADDASAVADTPPSNATGKLLGKAWLTTEPPVPLNESPVVEPDSAENPSHTVNDARQRTGEQQQQSHSSSLERAQYSMDDIGVRPSSSDFDYCSNYDRIVAQPLGFRRWFATHAVTDAMMARADAAKQDLARVQTMLDGLRSQGDELLKVMGHQKSDVEESEKILPTVHDSNDKLLENYYLLQNEMEYLLKLQDDLERECAHHQSTSRNQRSKFDKIPVEASAVAELHLLESSFKVLGDMSHQ